MTRFRPNKARIAPKESPNLRRMVIVSPAIAELIKIVPESLAGCRLFLLLPSNEEIATFERCYDEPMSLSYDLSRLVPR